MQTERHSPSISQALRSAVEHHRQGRLPEAERIYRQVLAAEPENPQALHLLGVIAHQAGENEVAVELIGRALRHRPAEPYFLNNLALALQELKRDEEALASYDRALSLKPGYAEAWNNRGSALRALERHEEALASYDRAFSLKPGYAEALSNRGSALRELKRHDEALASYDQALSLEPGVAEAWYNRGNALEELKRYDEALASHDRALSLKPDYAEAWNNRGSVLQELERFEEALASYGQALSLKPGYTEALNNRGSALEELGRYDEALASYGEALSLDPGYTDALYNHGSALQALDRHDEALASFEKALSLKPDFAEALNNRGSALKELKRYDEALASYDRALAARPDLAQVHWNESACRLLLGDFERGWRKYEWRWKYDDFRAAARDFPQPLWLGREEIAGKTLLLHAEQGLGDTLQFARYAQVVAGMGARVILEVQPALRTLLSNIPGAHQVLSRGEPLPEFDFHCPLLSLPLALGTTLETIPAPVPYLPVDEGAAARWRVKLARGAEKLVGVCWKGNPNYKGDRKRSIRLAEFAPLLTAPGVRFVSLQNEVRAEEEKILAANERILHLGPELGDFADTAALVSAMDLVISVDTAIAHLAGALARRVWVLLPFNPDWRWLLDRDDSPWYPTARLFRQTRIGDWDGVLRRIRAELPKLLAQSG